MEMESVFTGKEVARIDEELHNEMMLFHILPGISRSDRDILTALNILTIKVLRDKHEGAPIGTILEGVRDLLDSCIGDLIVFEEDLFSKNNRIDWIVAKENAAIKVKEKLMESAGMK